MRRIPAPIAVSDPPFRVGVVCPVKRLLVFQTLTMPGDDVVDTPENQDFNDPNALAEPGWPKMAFIEKKLAGDITNWWAPDHAGVEAMLHSGGLRVVARPGREMYFCEPADPAGARVARRWDEDELRAASGRSVRFKPAVGSTDAP